MKPTDIITTKSGLTVEIWQGDCLESLRAMPDESVHCCVTSPPYWGLRDYGCDGQIGLEQTPNDFVAALVDVFREVRRALRKDGTCWVNLGDSYYNYRPGKSSDNVPHAFGGDRVHDRHLPAASNKRKAVLAGLKEKDLIGIPWRVAFALQADGWYLRQDIIWHKPNPMPESVTDRCTKAHEYIFLLTKSARYFYDADAIMEPAAWERWGNQTERKSHPGTAGHLGGKSISELPIKDSKNKRSVWTVTTRGYPEAHFATFPPKLIEPCIKAGCPQGGTVLDPFGGSFTTAEVALQLGCNAVMCELNPEYIEMGKRRIQAEAAQGNLFT